MDNNAMNIELLKAMRGVWIIEIETMEKLMLQYPKENTVLMGGRIEQLKLCLQDLINIIGE